MFGRPKRKDPTVQGVYLEFISSQFITDEDEKVQLGCGRDKSLLNYVYFNGEIFGLRGSEHKNLNILSWVQTLLTEFEENLCKTFH